MEHGHRPEGEANQPQLPEPLRRDQIQGLPYERISSYLTQVGLKHIPHEISARYIIHWLENAREGVRDTEQAKETYLARVKKILELENYIGTEQQLGEDNKLCTVLGLVCDGKFKFYLLATEKETGKTHNFSLPRKK